MCDRLSICVYSSFGALLYISFLMLLHIESGKLSLCIAFWKDSAMLCVMHSRVLVHSDSKQENNNGTKKDQMQSSIYKKY